MTGKLATVNNIKLDIHDVTFLKNGGCVLVTLLHIYDELAEDWNVTAPNGECIKVIKVDAFGSIAKFRIKELNCSHLHQHPL